MIQFIGRFSRTPASTPIGTASVFVARDPAMALSPLRDLLREDADWNLLLSDITERATDAVGQLSKFEESFSGAPDDVPVSLLEPKMSAIEHRSPSAEWHPENATTVSGADQLPGSAIATSADGSVAWFVVEHHASARWGAVTDLEETSYELIILYFDSRCRLLYIYGSNNTGAYSELAAAVLGDGSQTVKGLPAFRVLARLDRLLPTNVGLLDARDHFNRFSMHVGSDVVDARRGRPAGQDPDPHRHLRLRRRRTRHYQCGPLRPFLVNAQAPNLKAWTEWCDEQGGKLLDGSVDLKQILDGFIIPIGLMARPPHVLLGLEWPWQIVGVSVTYDGYTYQLLDIDFEVDDYSTGGPFLFSLVTPAWRLAYRATFEPDGLTYTPLADDAEVASRPSPCRCALGSTRTSRRSSSTVTE